jgi:hypothetical protein
VIVGSNLELTYSDKRGLKQRNDTIYFVDSTLKIVTFYHADSVVWRINVIDSCGVPKVGEPEIRVLYLKDNFVNIVYGKHCYASIRIRNGKLTCGDCN